MFKKFLNGTFNALSKKSKPVSIVQASLDKAYDNVGAKRQHTGLDWDATVKAVQEMVDSAEAQWRATTKSHEILSDMLRHLGGFAWRRDADGRYLYVNQSMCSMMLIPDIRTLNKDMQLVCLNEVKGYTDEELVDAYIERTGTEHGFRDHAKLIDEQIKQRGETCRFMQFGHIDKVLRAYYTVASPMYDKGVFCGTAGFSIDETARCAYLKLQLEAMKYAGQLDFVGKGLYLTQVGDSGLDDSCLPF